MAQGGSWTNACDKCGRTHPRNCRDGQTCCFKCCGHFIREFPKNKQGSGNRGNKVEFSSVALPYRAAPRGATSSTSRGISSCEDHETSPFVITGMIKVFIFDVYALLNLGASLSFVTPYVANKFEILPKKLCESLCVSTPV